MNRTILITGASSGIGRDAALQLAQPGHHLILAARRIGALEAVAVEASERGATTSIIGLDLNSGDGIAEALRELKAVGGYPVLVNNAGMAEFGEFGATSWDSIQEMLQVNLIAPTKLCHGFVPYANSVGGGQIINILSMVANQTLPYTAAYATAKAGLLQLGRVIAAESRGQGLKVTAILPGAVNTPIWDGTGTTLNRDDMIPTEGVSTLIRDLVLMPLDRNIDEITVMPPKGKL